MGGVPETPKHRREITPAGANADKRFATVFVLSSRAAVRDVVFPAADACVDKQHAGRANFFRTRLWFNSRMPLCQGGGPGAIPGSRTNLPIAAHPHTRRWLDKQGAGLQTQIMQARYLPAVRGGDVSWSFSKWDRGSTRKAPASHAGSCGSVTRRLHHFLLLTSNLRRGRRGRLGGLISRFKRVRFPFPQPFRVGRPLKTRGCL